MAIFVNTNYSALQGQRYLNNVNSKLTTVYQRLSSGMRINSAKDDAAGLQIMDRLTSQINGLNQGNRNASDGIALAQTAESGMDEISGMLQKMRTLAVQASNGTNSAEDKAALSKEASALANEVSRIAKQTTFGGKTILNGMQANSILTGGTGDKGKTMSVALQVGANKGDTIKFGLNDMQFSAIAKRADGNMANVIGAGKVMNIAGSVVSFRFSDAKVNPSDAIDTIDKMIADVDSQRAGLGATQNRLESSIRNQSAVSVNTADARSRIRDTDFAEESANLARFTVMQQAAAAMLLQANTRPQLAHSLLG